MSEITLRPVENRDSAGLIDLVAACFADYPGCVLEVDLEEPELRAPGDAFEWMRVAERDGRIVGMIGSQLRRDSSGEAILELKKLYVAHACRGSGLARRLVDTVEERARECGVMRIELWTDTRFDKAHEVYEHFGYRRGRPIRDLHDLSNTREYYFSKQL